MNINEPYKVNDIDLNNIVFKKIKSISSNKKIIFLKYKNDKINNFVIQLSKIKNNTINNQNEIDFVIDNKNYTDFLENLDDFIVAKASQNHSWFDHLDDISSMNYQRILRDDNSIRLRLCNNKDLVTQLIINDEVVSNFDDIFSDESTTKMILEVYAIWIKSNSFGLLLRPVNISMKIKEKLEYNYKFLEDSDDESIISEYNDELTPDNNDELFMKTTNLFVNNEESLSTSDDSDDDLNINKLILG